MAGGGGDDEAAAALLVDGVDGDAAPVAVRAAAGKFARNALPYTASALVSMVGIFLCNVMLATLGDEVLSASALMLTVQTVITTTSAGSLYVVGVYAAKAASSAGNDGGAGVRRLLVSSLALSTLLAGYGAVLCLTARYYLRWLQQDAELVAIAQQFFDWYALALPALNGVIVEGQLALGLGRARVALVSNIVQYVILVVLAYPFIVGAGHIPVMSSALEGMGATRTPGWLSGARGYGIAYATGCWVTWLGLSLYLRYAKSFARFRLFRGGGGSGSAATSSHGERNGGGGPLLSWTLMRHVLRDGFPIAAQLGAEEASSFSTTLLVGVLGPAYLAALQIVNQFSVPFISLVFSSGHAAGVLVSEYASVRRFRSARRLGNVSIAAVVAVCTLGVVLLVALARPLSSLFISDGSSEDADEIYRLAREFFVYQGIALVFDAVRNGAGGALRGFADTRASSLVTLVTAVCIVAGGLALLQPLGLEGVLGARLCGIALSGLLLLHRWFTMASHVVRHNVGPETANAVAHDADVRTPLLLNHSDNDDDNGAQDGGGGEGRRDSVLAAQPLLHGYGQLSLLWQRQQIVPGVAATM